MKCLRTPGAGVALALVVMLAAGSSAAADQAAPPVVELEDYVVERGDTCLKIATQHLGDAKRLADIHTHNDLGPSPHRLKPGSILRLPRVGAPRAPDARITFVRNRVEAFKPAPKPAEVNETLFRGHKVGTKERASTELLFADQTRIQLGEQTLIVVLGGQRSQASTVGAAETTLLNGSLRARLGELAGATAAKPALVKTDAAELSLGPGEAQVQVDEKKATRLAVYRGRSQARAKRKTVEVPEGFGNKTEVGQQPGAPKPLPPAPAWLTSPPAELAVAATADVTAKYGPGVGSGPAAASWHVQIARDESFNDLVVDVRVPVAVTDLEAKELTPGLYLTRVSAIDGDDFEGPFGAVASTKVTLAPPPPPPPPPPPAPPTPPPAPAPLAPPPPGAKLMLGGALLGGAAVSAVSDGFLGPVLGLELDVERRATPDASHAFALGLRGLYERFGSSSAATESAPVSRREGFDLALLAMVRLGKPSSRLSVYAGLAPQLVVAHVREESGRTFNHAWFAGAAIVGAEVRLGPGRLLLELDGRYPTRRPSMSTDAQLGFLHVLAGYRLGL